MLHNKLSLMRGLAGAFGACALLNLAAAQTSAPAPAPEAKPADSSQPNVITAKVAEPTLLTPGPSAATIKAAKAAGYQVNGKGDKTKFCKSETEIGKRIPDTHCYTEDQFTQIQLKNEQEREMLKTMQGSHSSSH